MRVPDYMLNCIGFIGEYHASPTGDTFDTEASGFFVNIPSAINANANFYVFVTAKHVAEGLRSRETVITVNRKGGGVMVVENLDDNWYLHPDESVDVAVISMNPSQDMDIKSIPLEMFVDNEILQEQNIGIGRRSVHTGSLYVCHE
jgi:hypothetical protein